MQVSDNVRGAENQQERSIRFEPIGNPQRPYAGSLPSTLEENEMVRSLRRRKEVGGNDQPTVAELCRTVTEVTAHQRNSLSGEQLPRIGAIRCVNPAHNGEALTVCLDQGRGDRRRVMPWEALCRSTKRYGPVTTDPFGVRLRSCHTRAIASECDKSTTGARRGLSARSRGSPVVHLRICRW
jgi:hypothetical protein